MSVKTISGRGYVYSRMVRVRGGKPVERYEHPEKMVQPKTMEYLSAKDKGIIERAFQKGVAISTIQDHVWHAIGTRVTASTIYAYMNRHGVTRTKRKKRSDKGKEKISRINNIGIINMWNKGGTWQEISQKIKQQTGEAVGRSAIYAHMRTHGNAAKRKAALKKKKG